MPTVQHEPTHDRLPYADDDRVEVYEDEYGDQGALSLVNMARAVAMVAAGILLVIGVIAVIEIDWDPGGFDAPPVEVAGMTFTPEVAVATIVLGLIALGAAAVRTGDVRLTVGALLVALGVGLILATDGTNDLALSDRHGWLALGVGAVIAISGLLTSGAVVHRRRAYHEHAA
jgi:hypothetical protein